MLFFGECLTANSCLHEVVEICFKICLKQRLCSWVYHVFPVLCINTRLYIIESPFLWKTGLGEKVYVRMQNNFPRLLAQCDHKTSTAHCAVTL